MREQQSCSRKQALSQTPQGGSPHDSSRSWGWKLPTPPWPPRSETKKAETQQMAFRDAMEVARSPAMTWEDQVQEEEDKCEGHSSTRGDSQSCPSSPRLEGCDISDISMAEEGPQQHDSDVVVEEEREESMETDAPLDSAKPTPPSEKAMPENLKAEVEEDRRWRKVLTRTHPTTLILMRTSFWGHRPTFLFPGDTLMTPLLSSFPWKMMIYKCCSCTMRMTMSTMTLGLEVNGIGFA